MQSYKNRFNGQKGEIVDYTRVYGIFEAMQKYAPNGDYLSFKKFVEDASQEDNIGINPKISSTDLPTLADYIVDAFIKKIERLKAQLEEERRTREDDRLKRKSYESNIRLKGAKLYKAIEEL